MAVPMPSIVVLIICKTVLNPGPVDENSKFTHYENRSWAVEDSMMVCRRLEVQLTDTAYEQGAAAQPFNQHHCQRAGISEGVAFNMANRNRPWRWFRSACPVPVVNMQTGEIISWTLPPCPMPDVIQCEVDSAI